MKENDQLQRQVIVSKTVTNKMSFGEAIRAILSNFFKFSGRARRKEYWTFMLFYFLIIFGAMYLDAATGFNPYIDGSEYGPITMCIYFILFVPWLAVSIRRFHDCGFSWAYIFWIFLPIVGGIIIFITTIEDSEKKANEYGESPKYREIEEED